MSSSSFISSSSAASSIIVDSNVVLPPQSISCWIGRMVCILNPEKMPDASAWKKVFQYIRDLIIRVLNFMNKDWKEEARKYALYDCVQKNKASNKAAKALAATKLPEALIPDLKNLILSYDFSWDVRNFISNDALFFNERDHIKKDKAMRISSIYFKQPKNVSQYYKNEARHACELLDLSGLDFGIPEFNSSENDIILHKKIDEVNKLLPNLKTLNLSNIHIKNCSTELFGLLGSPFKHLETLNISHNDFITDAHLSVLNHPVHGTAILSQLTELNLTDCPHITAAAKQALRTARPHLTIIE